jgi:hypothetical protein
MKSIFKLAAAALALLVGLSVAPAFAANAYVNQTSSIYKKATSSSTVIKTIGKGSLVTVIDCTVSYCLLQLPGPDGWIKKGRLSGLQGGKPASNVPFSFGLSIGGNGKPSISIGIGNDAPPPVIIEEDKVCFYKGINYTGSSFCVEPGESDDSLSGSWDDNISSIKVYGEAEVTVCSDEDLEGICANISSSKKSLPGALDDEISSFEVN